MPEGEKHWEPVVIGGDNLPSLVRIGLTDLQNIWGASGPPWPPPGSGTTARFFAQLCFYNPHATGHASSKHSKI